MSSCSGVATLRTAIHLLLTCWSRAESLQRRMNWLGCSLRGQTCGPRNHVLAARQFYANMQLPHSSLSAAFFTDFSKVRTSHIFLHRLAFSTAILILSVFILPISIRFRYRDHLVANRMAPSMCPDPCGMRWGSWFQAILYHIPAYLCRLFSVYVVHVFFKMPHETGMPILGGGQIPHWKGHFQKGLRHDKACQCIIIMMILLVWQPIGWVSYKQSTV